MTCNPYHVQVRIFSIGDPLEATLLNRRIGFTIGIDHAWRDFSMRKLLGVGMAILLCTLCSCTGARTKNLHDARWALQLRATMDQKQSSEGTFSVGLLDDNLYWPKDSTSLAYPWIAVEATFSNIPGDKKYILYCPNTGCLYQPEVVVPIPINKEGQPILQMPGIASPVRPRYFVSLLAIPGFCSDWYLFSEHPFTVYHTTFTYQPITTKTEDGKELTISKKESGGNLLEITLKGFGPYEQVAFTSESAGELLTSTPVMDKNGTHTLFLAPQVIGTTKGNITINVTAGKETLQASTEWDMSTLDIRRRQPYSWVRKQLPLDSCCTFSVQKPPSQHLYLQSTSEEKK
jgi:hypothetical protein